MKLPKFLTPETPADRTARLARKPPEGAFIGAHGPFTRNGRPRRIVSMGWTEQWMEPATSTVGSRFGVTRAGQGGRMVRFEVYQDLDDPHWAARLYENGQLDVSEPPPLRADEWRETIGTVRRGGQFSGRHPVAASGEPTTKAVPVSEYGRR